MSYQDRTLWPEGMCTAAELALLPVFDSLSKFRGDMLGAAGDGGMSGDWGLQLVVPGDSSESRSLLWIKTVLKLPFISDNSMLLLLRDSV